MKAVSVAAVNVVLAATPSWAQEPAACRVLCSPEFKIEPTITFTNLFGSPRIISDDGTVTPESRETQFELILSLGLPTRLSWLEFTVEAIFLPFDRDSTPELEFETNFIWLPSERTSGWVTSHFDIVDNAGSFMTERSQMKYGRHVVERPARLGYRARASRANTGPRMEGLIPEAYAPFAQRIFALLTQEPTAVTTESEVAEAVWRAANDASGQLRFPAGADAVALAQPK